MSASANETSIPERQPSHTEPQLTEFAHLLRLRREAAGLSRRRLANLARLSEATIKFIETARTRPTRATLLRLLLVNDLRLLPTELPLPRRDLPFHLASLPSLPPPLNAYLAPGFEPLRLVEELDRTLHGAGGYIEQSSLYLTPHSALAYLQYQRQAPEEISRRQGIPLHTLAAAVAQNQQSHGLTVLALGPGDGRLEVRLVEHLLTVRPQAIGLWLLDISQSLLTVSYQHASAMLRDRPEAEVLAIAGNFHHLPSYTELFAASKKTGRQRLFVLFGTLAHLDNEARFLRDTLGSVAKSGDLLLLDAELTREYLDVNRSGATPWPDPPCSAALREWLSGPIYRAQGRRLSRHEQITLQRIPDGSGLVPGSTAQNTIITVESRGERQRQFALLRRFSMLRHRRFPLSGLQELLSRSGWRPVSIIHGTSEASTASLAFLCQRHTD